MRTTFLTWILLGVITQGSLGQGTFIWSNFTAPTRLYAIDGPLAGPGIWGQMLAGQGPDDLAPLSVAIEHVVGGWIGSPGIVSVPGIPCREYAYIQMVAWDGRYWGTDLENVPLDQLGRTDIVRHWLSGCDMDPVGAPRFSQPAIVPPIPEPSTALLGLLAAALILAAQPFRERRGCSPLFRRIEGVSMCPVLSHSAGRVQTPVRKAG